MVSSTRRLWLGSALAAVGGALLPACGGGSSSGSEPEEPPEPQPSVERDVAPAEIDPRVDTATEAHVAINPDPGVTQAQRLFVFLPGTEGAPGMYRKILRAGAARGYHTIGLNYPNAEAVGRICRTSTDDDCYWDVRREIVTGDDLTNRVDISRPNGVDTRLAMALGFLHGRFPNEGWGQFLNSGNLAWPRIVVAGHSQGGGHAGVIAKLRPVYRAVYFAAPADWEAIGDAPASWLDRSSQTPASRQFGFGHLQDPLVPHDEVVPIWTVLGLDAYGDVVSVDDHAAPYGNSHMLSTDAEPDPGLAASPHHGAPVLDAVTPTGPDGKPLYLPVWNHLCFP